jgi:S1-C subfamily serine protease
MKIHQSAYGIRWCLLTFIIISFLSVARPEDWNVKGKIYKDVKVIKHDDAYVTILYFDGGAKIAISDLSSDLQKSLNYDSKTAEQEKKEEDTQNQIYKIRKNVNDYKYDAVGTIIQVLPDGIMAHFTAERTKARLSPPSPQVYSASHYGVEDLGDGVEGSRSLLTYDTQHIPVTFYTDLAFIACDTTRLVENQGWKGSIWSIGTFSYSTEAGPINVIPKFTTNPDDYSFYAVNKVTASDFIDKHKSTNYMSYGTGVFVSKDGFIITASHVVQNASSIKILTQHGIEVANVVKIDPDADVALLKCDGQFQAVPIKSSESVKLGQSVFTLGFPDIQLQGVSPKMTRGEISSQNGAQDDPRDWQISVPVQPGNSGGPLFDSDGNVVGLVVAKLNALNTAKISGELPENVNYAVKSAYVLPLFDASMTAHLLPEKTPMSGVEKTEDVVDRVQNSVALILVY